MYENKNNYLGTLFDRANLKILASYNSSATKTYQNISLITSIFTSKVGNYLKVRSNTQGKAILTYL